MRRYILFSILVFVATIAVAQSISVQAPDHVALGENFRLSYTINTQDVEDFRAGSIPSAIEVIAGPYESRQSSYQMINGHTSSSSSITYTYTLYAGKNGTFTIPAAHARVAGKHVSSQAVRITVSGSARNANNVTPKMHNDYDEPDMRSEGSRISGNDLFIKVSANKKRVHEQEPVLLTYKVYTTVNLTQLEGKMPDLTGFHTQEVKLPQQKSFHIEQVNGRSYKCVTWSQYVMYPQMTGRLTIPSITFKGIVVQQNRSVDPFEAFFNGGSGYVEVHRNIVAPGLDIQVDPLPSRPSGFSGGVGRFNISAQLNKTSVKAGDPISLRVVIGGTGNLKLIKQPEVEFPKDFDKYDAKVTDKTKLTANGIEGNMVYDFLAVPRNQGTFTIPAVKLTYYDTGSNTYKTIQSNSFTVNVAKGDGTSAAVSDYADNNNKDIHAIKEGKTEQHAIDEFFYGSTVYWIALLVLLIAFITLLIIFRQRAIDNADIVKMRGKKANRVATKRLKTASRLMFANKQNEFYDEVMRALWGYVSDKLNMPVEQLSRENIAENLHQHAVDEQTITKFLGALDECEYERYAPGDPSGNMSKTFESAMTAIEEIENVMKNGKRKASHHATGIFLLFLLFVSLPSSAITKRDADLEYKKGNYQQAIKDYQELLKKGVSADLYYNLGNAYFRSDNITQAVLAYERAHLLSPGDEDIRFNLEFARSKTIDKITPESEMFFVTWYRALVNYTSVDCWATVAIVSIALALIQMLVYLFATQLALRKVGFFGALLFLLLFAGSNLFAYQQKSTLENRNGAIVIAPSVNVKKTPDMNGSDDFVLHEGTRVSVTDRSMKQWRGIRLDDGREGWLLTNQIEDI
jgi:tetratricopeptide (TPR) repeat protein